jgi:hypothetical protein
VARTTTWQTESLRERALESPAGGARTVALGTPARLIIRDGSAVHGAPAVAMPRVAVMRSFVMNHMVHHRAQLGVYLRMNNVAVPSIYGPSADEGQM